MTNLLQFTHYTDNTLDKYPKTQVDVIYTDFQKGFDKVNHERLLHKLSQLSFSEQLLKLFKLYLQVRQQYVSYNGALSHMYEYPSGVPKGSSLSLYFFILFVIDIPQNLHYAQAPLYADDLKIFPEIKIN